MQGDQPQRICKELVLGIVVSLCFTALSHADPAAHRESRPRKSKTKMPIAQPEIDLSPQHELALLAAYRAAVSKLDKKQSCRELFAGLDLEGIHAMARQRYQQAESPNEEALCASGIMAFTGVGQSRILICQRFHAAARSQKIAVLIHEALHTAGLREAPLDPDGLTSLEITHMVRRACSL